MKNKLMLQFFIRGKKNEKDIKELVSRMFGTNDIGNLMNNKTTRISYDYQYYEGDFQTSIELYVEEEFATLKNIKSDIDLGLIVASKLKESVLVSDEKLNPYTWFLIDGAHVYEAEQLNKDEGSMIVRKKNNQPITF